MSGALHPPLLAPEQTSKLLDEIIYERVLSCVDVDALLHFECELSCAFDEAGFDAKARACTASDLAKDMVDRALHRLADERWVLHLRTGRARDLEPWDCELCEEAPPTPKPAKRKSS